jgi:muconolactone delta-isomerase
VSRFTAIVRKPCDDDQTERIDCDGVHVDQGGDLHVQLTRSGDMQTVARFQHGHWASYALEPTVDEELCAGRMTLNQYRDSIGEHQVDGDCCAEAPVEAEALPEVGEMVHVWRKSGKIAACCPMRVAGRCATDSGVALALAGPLPWSPEFEQLLTSVHDETRTKHASWHWPCDGDGQDAEPEPKPPAPNITINVSGSVLSERDLRDMIRKILTDDARRSMPSGFTFGR